jgi:glutamyl-tRNA synthetase
MHLGLARTALLGYLRARSQGGTFVLRMEDLDTPRVVKGAAAALLDDLRWLGMTWDAGPDVGGPHAPYVQSQRLALYAEASERLRAAGYVYPCSCSRREINLASAPHGPSEFGAVYPGTCRQGPSRPHAPQSLRFRVPDVPPSFVDGLRQARVEPVAQGDFVLQRADGMYSYQLAVVVDDIAMGITEVLRGEDLAGCTGWQIALYEALGARAPAFVHVPLLLGPDGKRLAKRDAPVAVADYRARGMSAAQLVGFLAWSCGLVERGAHVMPGDLIADFALERVHREPTRLAARDFPE